MRRAAEPGSRRDGHGRQRREFRTPRASGTGPSGGRFDGIGPASAPHTSRISRSSTMASSKRDTLIVGLRNAYALEGQALSTMRNTHSRLETLPAAQGGRRAAHRGDRAASSSWSSSASSRFGESPSTLKESATKLAGNMQAMVHAIAERRGAEGPLRALRLRAFRAGRLSLADRHGRGCGASPASPRPAARSCARRRRRARSWGS